uniref:Uncharacterized protein n=1 Tax=Oryza meridionalis TaxID=40149 RepID=A0A0E0C0S7_9ORYZ
MTERELICLFVGHGRVVTAPAAGGRDEARGARRRRRRSTAGVRRFLDLGREVVEERSGIQDSRERQIDCSWGSQTRGGCTKSGREATNFSAADA